MEKKTGQLRVVLCLSLTIAALVAAFFYYYQLFDWTGKTGRGPFSYYTHDAKMLFASIVVAAVAARLGTTSSDGIAALAAWGLGILYVVGLFLPIFAVVPTILIAQSHAGTLGITAMFCAMPFLIVLVL
jgi:hypothetical protein